ncbi:MAG: disulfide bond formation protein B [Luminiphilus sp.]|jgi:disulfide bond formation protein DsbB|nr:disulfide bond formation protein B [Luminiphilus sp.]MDG1461100.1 disulfide bond formation protein B [Luminiphilus sp.]
MQSLETLFKSRSYWLMIAAASLAMLVIALYYQYVLGEEPCQVCIQARLWVFALLLVSMTLAALPKNRVLRLSGNLLALACALGLGERAWFLYQLENGIGNGSCEFQLGMPDWFAIDQWFPSLFEVRNLCSFTPEMLFGLSMAEGLLLIAGLLGVFISCALVSHQMAGQAESRSTSAPG